ncbi:type I-G CRISPR-associated helicase/endonuclease Cas3g [Streptomyces johnsoniae]|uniref:Type I-U CRISPR-associated helicase/endonuclease Cas3 n=1 Tax=Streptomyces johnsoniae TaxID=3075532 RepID=A0ABU2SCY6_9ACTN|nr:type I-U CRISPR-associated helicase/endonuclease Cas3 [Streptomyces sp. DSM 41886]MDT0446815.1 type I-U CRISPR-associated helicase/endonuclease Cas3 [Streptomyces sp. DSM 41886]
MSLELSKFADFFYEANTPCTATCAEPCNEHPEQPSAFAWQREYVRHVADGGSWLDLDIPTGLGKTSLIDMWAFLLAWQQSNGRPRTVPLRLFFVVDRRLVVDQAHDHAQRLAARLTTAKQGSALAAVAEALNSLKGGAPLQVVRMRGGVDWASRWLASPAQPAVVTATVDQYGSRLLFRGYHTSPTMRPVDAALCGMDALLAVDEAHIALPLLTTATDCAAYQATATVPALAGRAVRVVSLSATAQAASARPRFTLPDADWHHPIARARLHAARRITTIEATGTAKTPTEAFARSAEQLLDPLLAAARHPVIGVIANTIATARATHQRLAARADLDTVLLTGRCRPAERDELLAGPLLNELMTGTAPHRQRPLVVVATQTVEVGWDISFAALCTETASLDAFVQRLGRLNRKGHLDHAPAAVVRSHAPEPGEEDDIPVYGAAAAHTWTWLTHHHQPLRLADTTAEDLDHALAGGLEVNPATLPALLKERDPQELTAAAPKIPRIHATLLDSWARTQPAPYTPFDQELEPFLHGLATAPPDVQIAWRADLPTHGDPNQSAMPGPHARELLALPAAHLRRLVGAERTAPALSDMDTHADEQPTPGTLTTRLVRWNPPDTRDDPARPWELITDAAGIVPGGIYLLPAALGGHDAYGFTGRPGEQKVPDLGDFPHHSTTAATRLDARVLASLLDLDTTGQDTAHSAITTAIRRLRGNPDEPAQQQGQPTEDVAEEPLSPGAHVHALLNRLHDLAAAPGPEARFTHLLTDRLEFLRDVSAWEISRPRMPQGAGRIVIDADDRLILAPPRPPAGRREPQVGLGDDDADASSLTRTVDLPTHSAAVADRTGEFASALNLPPSLITAMETAGSAHDIGKTHPRFQCMLCGGDSLLAESLDRPLAKSGMDPADRAARRRAARLANWPTQLRHEALSAAAVHTWLTSHPPAAADTDHDLITHLVAAHHGHSRPLLPPVTDPEPLDVTCTMPDGRTVTVNTSAMGTDWAGHHRFTTLNHRYGPWGLALLETILRLADMACSEEGT